MKKPRLYLKKAHNGVYYIHWTEGRIGKRRTTKTRNRAEAEKRFKEAKGGPSDPVRPEVTTQAPAASESKSPRDGERIYADEAELAAIRRDPVGHAQGRVVSARSKLTLLMLQYENAVLAKKPETKLAILRIRILLARAELSREFTLYEDTKAMAAGEPLAPPDCDSILWPRRPRRTNSGDGDKK